MARAVPRSDAVRVTKQASARNRAAILRDVAPIVRLSGGALEVANRRGGSDVLLSLSDEADYVVAFAALIP